MEYIIEYVRTHRQQHLDELFQLLRIPSVSTLPAHTDDMAACAKFLADNLGQLGMKRVQIMPTQRHPVVYAEWLELSEAPTILIYGHYDVQPAEPLELWDSSPFEPYIRDGEIYARGVADDKGQFFAYVKAVEAFLKTKGMLPVNVKFLLEGEEEIGSENLHAFVAEHAELLQADAVLLSDNCQFASGLPTICYGTRGLTHCQIEVETAARDLHSGGFGGLADNPIQVLADIVSALKDEDERVTIPGFYDDVVPISQAEKEEFEQFPFDEEQFKQKIGIRELVGEKGFPPFERRWTRPTLDVNGIIGGFTRIGIKTIIPAKAMANITMRLVPNQDSDKIYQQAKTYIEQLAPSSAKVTVTGEGHGKAYLTPREHPIIPYISKGLEAAYQHETVFSRTGGTIGVLSSFSQVLQIPIVMIGLSNPDDNIHAPNEHMTEALFYLGIEAIARVLGELEGWRP